MMFWTADPGAASAGVLVGAERSVTVGTGAEGPVVDGPTTLVAFSQLDMGTLLPGELTDAKSLRPPTAAAARRCATART